MRGIVLSTAVALVLVLVLVGCGTSSTGTTATTVTTSISLTTASTTVTTAGETTATAEAPTTAGAAPTSTTTTQPTTTTMAAPISTTSTTVSEERLLDTYASVVEEFSPKMIEIIKSDSLTESVKFLKFDRENRRVALTMSSTYTGADNYDLQRVFYDDQAWTITQAIAAGLFPKEITDFFQDTKLPAFRLVLDGIVYQVPGKIMSGIVAKETSMEDWLAAAGKS